MTDKPALVGELEGVFGGASAAAFGSSVFFEKQLSSSYPLSLVDASIDKYRHFCGETWTRYGEEKWMSGWQELYHRSPGATAGILCEFSSIKVQPFRSCAAIFLEENEDNDSVHQLLSRAFDSEGVKELRIFSLGDGEAMSGFLIAAEISDLGRLFVTFLMD